MMTKEELLHEMAKIAISKTIKEVCRTVELAASTLDESGDKHGAKILRDFGSVLEMSYQNMMEEKVTVQ